MHVPAAPTPLFKKVILSPLELSTLVEKSVDHKCKHFSSAPTWDPCICSAVLATGISGKSLQ